MKRDSLRSYNLRTNPYVVKPMSYHDFVEAIKEVRPFWSIVNQPPLVKEGGWR